MSVRDIRIDDVLDACQAGNVRFVGDCLTFGFDPDTSDRDGTTALMVAANYDRPDVVKLLLEAGANHSLGDRHGRPRCTTPVAAPRRLTDFGSPVASPGSSQREPTR